MLVHVPADGSRATLISIPRDSYVDIPGHPSNKINAAYADGYYFSDAHGAEAQQAAGASTLVATVKKLTGVTIDHYVQVGFAGFVDIVRAIGDIPIDLCKSVDDTHAHNVADGETGGSGFKMSAGHHDLTPQQALEFVRQRHNIPGPVTDDLGRELRQRYFLSQAFKRILSANVLLNPVKLHDLINAVDGAFTFDSQQLRPHRVRPADDEPDRGQHQRQVDPHRGLGHDRRAGRAQSRPGEGACLRPQDALQQPDTGQLVIVADAADIHLACAAPASSPGYEAAQLLRVLTASLAPHTFTRNTGVPAESVTASCRICPRGSEVGAT